MNATASYTIAANLRWFALVYTGVTLVAVAAFAVAENYGITLPSSGISIGIYIGAVYAAGYRFAQKTDNTWTSGQRNALALGYTIVSFVVSTVLVAGLVAIDPAMGAAFAAMIASIGAVFAVIVVVLAAIFYAAARLALMFAARRGGKR